EHTTDRLHSAVASTSAPLRSEHEHEYEYEYEYEHEHEYEYRGADAPPDSRSSRVPICLPARSRLKLQTTAGRPIHTRFAPAASRRPYSPGHDTTAPRAS